MIEIVSQDRCTACNICVRVCPANVFDIVADEPPRIARQDDCQTCFLCEIYCPEDALYVATNADRPTGITEDEVGQRGLFGSYARALGWRVGRMGGTGGDATMHLRRTLDAKTKPGG
jgi:NAD-dependent dihydropyrimidine dehydrogenase PreA subunit